MPTASERAKARSAWPVKRTSLDHGTEAFGPTDAQAAWDAVIELTRESYAAAGEIPPRLPRAQWPSRLIRPGAGDDGR